LTYLASIRVETRRASADRARERRRAIAIYLGRLTIAVSVIREWPPELTPTPRERLRKVTIERSARVRANDWLHQQKRMREVLGPEPYAPMFGLIEAYSHLRLVGLDERVWDEVVATLRYVERLAHDRSPEALEAWGDMRMRLFDAIRESGDEVAIEAAEPAESVTEPAESLATQPD